MTEETIPKEVKAGLIEQAENLNLKGIPGTPGNLAATALSKEQLSRIPGTQDYRQANATPIGLKED